MKQKLTSSQFLAIGIFALLATSAVGGLSYAGLTGAYPFVSNNDKPTHGTGGGMHRGHGGVLYFHK